MAVSLIVTRGLGLLVPPELYTSPVRAQREAASLALHLSRRRSQPEPAVGDSVSLGAGKAIHLVPVPFDPPWRACPLWLGIEWKDGQVTPRVTPMAADDEEARAWFNTAARKAPPNRSLKGAMYEIAVSWRGSPTYVGVHRAKRICGPM